MEKSCEQIEKMLVDYADGELSPSELSDVGKHLSQCERCRVTLKALRRSLELAGIVWADGLEEMQGVGVPQTRATVRFKWRRYATIAASILIATGISITWRVMTKPSRDPPTIAEIEREIEDSGRAARLLAATELLAGCPGTQKFVKNQYCYIVEMYPQTPAAAEARLRIR
ncbi:MAG: anti-sigma factor family protein [Planctomycetota bacterium]|jgi:anti-sigma factor RsiW